MQGMTRGEGTVDSQQLQQRLSCEEATLFQVGRWVFMHMAARNLL